MTKTETIFRFILIRSYLRIPFIFLLMLLFIPCAFVVGVVGTVAGLIKGVPVLWDFLNGMAEELKRK